MWSSYVVIKHTNDIVFSELLKSKTGAVVCHGQVPDKIQSVSNK